MKKILGFVKKNASWVLLVTLVAVFSVLVPQFRTWNNFITILKQISVSGILAIGVAIVLISGQIDLSTGSQIAMSGMICSLLITKGNIPFIPALLLSMIITTLIIGLINGLTVSLTRMPSMIATLGTMNIGAGLAFWVNDGKTVYGLPESAKIIGQEYLGPIPVSVIVMIAALLIGAFILNKTTFGRKCFAVGSNIEAARLSGINVKLITIMAFLICSLFASLAGVVLMSRLNSGVANAGATLFLDVIIACVIGGISSSGGEGRIFGLLGGILVMGVLSNGMGVMGLRDYIQDLCKGAILIIAVGTDAYRRFVTTEKKVHVIRSSQSTETKKTRLKQV